MEFVNETRKSGARAMTYRRRVGDIVKIPLGDGAHTFAHVLPEASFAVYDSRCLEMSTLGDLIHRPILFFVAVMHRAVKTGRWQVVGQTNTDALPTRPPTFIQDP